MLNRREFLTVLASTATCALVACADRRKMLPMVPIQYDPRGGGFFRTAAMTGRVTGESAVVNLITAADLPEDILARARWAESLDELPVSPHVSPTAAIGQSLASLELPTRIGEKHSIYLLAERVG